MKRLLGLFITLLIYVSGGAQQILLLAETFEGDTSGSSFVLNFGGPANNSGTNQWVVNSQYNGQPLYPNTPPEDSIANGGTIYLAPHSHYLHIHDKAAEASGIANANWNTSAASDRFCYIGSPFCTAGLTNVTFTFFWICQGDSNAYGQVYYNANGAGWIQTGQPKYYNQSEWIYESLLDTNFNNLQSLQFGFRWVNPQTTDSTDVSFGIDDVIAVGNYDSISDPTTMSVFIVPPDTVCQGDPITFTLQLAQPLCDGEYDIQMSDALGSFDHPYDLGTYGDLPGGYTIYQDLQTLGVPTNITGNCFKIRIQRLTQPIITSDTSVCFAIKHCPNIIFNESVPVLALDADTACVLSELDVYFNSTGIFGANNVYYAELSDSNGNFADSTRLGQLPTANAYPAIPQGDVTGLIPASVPAACGYYVRVRSTNPAVIGPSIGPFCITHCDEITNNHTDVHLCISSGPYPSCDTLRVQPHYWGTDAQYDTCNKWIVELLDMQSLQVINDGFFGVFYDSIGGFFRICAPSTADSISFLPPPQWAYYLRIKSTCSSEAWNETGSIVRITIGAPQPTPLNLTVSDSFACNEQGSIISLYVSPFNYPTNTYYWSSNLLNNGNAFTWPNNPLSITLNPQVAKGTYTFYVQESNNGCFGPNSAPATVTIIGLPIDTIRGPQRVCVGDTAAYNVTFQRKTYYDWTAPPGVQVFNSSNVQARMIFANVGVYTISCHSIDSCGDYDVSLTVKVVAPFPVQGLGDTTVCAGQPVNLGVQTGEDLRVFTLDTFGTTTAAGAMFNLRARYDVTIDSFAVRYQKAGNVNAQIYGKNGSYVGYEQSSSQWYRLADTIFTVPANIITVIPYEVNVSIPADSTYAFYVTTNNNGLKEYLTQGTGIQQGVDYASDSVLTFQQGSSNVYPFSSSLGPYVLNTQIYYSTKGGFHYTWSNGDSGQFIQIKPLQSANYSVYVFDSAACSNTANVFVGVNAIPSVNAGPDTTVCPDSNYVMPATSSQLNVIWTPAFGLSDSAILNPVFNSPDSVMYVLEATGDNGCVNKDSVLISVIKVLLNLPPVGPICSDSFLTIPATTSAHQVVWSPSTGLNRTDTINPIFNYSQAVTYFVTATDKGCVVSDSLRVDVELCASHLIAPKAFSPNGDGSNDHFTIFGDNIVTFQIRIFNRWGEEVYQSNDVSALNQMGQGWDGTYKGKKQDAGTFAWYITAKDVNGKNIQLKGNVILVR